MTNFVELYKSTDTNMPPLCGTVGQIKVLFDALLVDGPGFTGVSVTSITRSGTTATATVSAADAKRLRTGMLITISGATGGDASLYNISALITYTPGNTTFTYTMAGTPTGSATGTLLMAATQPLASITKSGAIALATLSYSDTTIRSGMHMVIAGCTGGDASIYNITTAIKIGANWIASTAYVLGDLAVNDTGKMYICRTAGTAASSGGPTGTGSAITDGSCTWDYVGALGSTFYFTYTMGSTPSSNAAGTPVFSRAPLGWARPFAAGTNAQTYRSADATSNRFYLQIIDNGATAGAGKEAQMYAAEVMTADQTVSSGRFPTTTQAANGLCLRKSTTADTVVREWTLIGDDRTFYFIPIAADATVTSPPVAFGHFISDKPGDGFNTFIAATLTFNSASNIVYGICSTSILSTAISTSNGLYVARNYNQLGSSSNANMVGAVVSTLPAAVGILSYPNPVDNGFYCQQYLINDTASSKRGRFPGYYCSLHLVPFNHYDIVQNITGLPGVTLLAVQMTGANSGAGQGFFDVTGPWS